jgi:transcription antitermination factor NusG
MLPNQKESWFAVQVTPRHEKAVDTVLQYKNYGHFLPTCRTPRNWSDRVKIIERPLFPGYVFVRSHSSCVGKVRSTPGVIRIVSFGGSPCAVPDSQIEALQRLIWSNRDICSVPYLEIGQKVQIIAGPLLGITGIITQLKNRHRLVVSLDLIMRSVVVEVDKSEVEPQVCGSAA